MPKRLARIEIGGGMAPVAEDLGESLAVRFRPADGVEGADRDEVILNPCRMAARHVTIETDLARVETKGPCSFGSVPPLAPDLRQARHAEAGISLALSRDLNNTDDDADGLLEPEGACAETIIFATQRQEHCGADRGMSCERQFPGRREDAKFGPMTFILRGQDEHRLRQIEFPRDPLHPGRVEPICIEHDRKGIAGELLSREHIERNEAAWHDPVLWELCT
jgi:hypothetical protein